MYIDSKAKSPYHNAVTVPFLLSIQCPKYKQFIDLGPRPRIGKYNFDEVYTFLIFQIEILIKIGGETVKYHDFVEFQTSKIVHILSFVNFKQAK